MAKPPRKGRSRLRLQDLCTRLGVSYRDARYVCEKGWLPAGIDPEPGRGNHRLLSPVQALYLAIVLKLKACGVKTSLAAQVAALAEGKVRAHLGYGQVAPCAGALEAGQRWLVEVGDMQFIRFVTGSGAAALTRTPWLDMASCRDVEGAEPVVSIQIDLSALGRLLQALED